MVRAERRALRRWGRAQFVSAVNSASASGVAMGTSGGAVTLFKLEELDAEEDVQTSCKSHQGEHYAVGKILYKGINVRR